MSTKMRYLTAAFCGIAAVFICIFYAKEVRADAERINGEAAARFGGNVVTLVTAKHELEKGAVVKHDDIAQREWLATLAPAGAITSADDIVGKTLTSSVAKGTPLADVVFRSDATCLETPAGYVAIAIPYTDKLGLVREASVGMRTAAYLVSDTGAHLIAHDMQILAVPDRMSTTAGSFLFAVRPDDVSAVLAGSASGNLRVVSPGSDTPVNAANTENVPTAVVPLASEVSAS